MAAPVHFQILSDLHLETHSSYQYPIRKNANNLALLGDIGLITDDGLFTWLESLLEEFHLILFLFGNHEPLHTSWYLAKHRMHSFAARINDLRSRSTIGEFVLLDQTINDIKNSNLTILGCTLFSHVPPREAGAVARRFVDFQKIKDWTVPDHNDAHERDLQSLNQEVSEIAETEPERQIAILTHYCPTLLSEASDPRHRSSPVFSGFATDLLAERCWTDPAVVFWAFGHTYFGCNFKEGGTGKTIHANQKGYAHAQANGFNRDSTVLVGRSETKGFSMLHV